MQTLPLSQQDRAVLTQRERFVWRFMKYGYTAVAVVAGLAAAKSLFIGGSYVERDLMEIALLALSLTAALALTHFVMVLFERRALSGLKVDLEQGEKALMQGHLDRMEESAGNGPTYLHVCNHESNHVMVFALRTIDDLSRIQPQALVGKQVAVEFAPNSGIVLSVLPSARN